MKWNKGNGKKPQDGWDVNRQSGYDWDDEESGDFSFEDVSDADDYEEESSEPEYISVESEGDEGDVEFESLDESGDDSYAREMEYVPEDHASYVSDTSYANETEYKVETNSFTSDTQYANEPDLSFDQDEHDLYDVQAGRKQADSVKADDSVSLSYASDALYVPDDDGYLPELSEEEKNYGESGYLMNDESEFGLGDIETTVQDHSAGFGSTGGVPIYDSEDDAWTDDGVVEDAEEYAKTPKRSANQRNLFRRNDDQEDSYGGVDEQYADEQQYADDQQYEDGRQYADYEQEDSDQDDSNEFDGEIVYIDEDQNGNESEEDEEDDWSAHSFHNARPQNGRGNAGRNNRNNRRGGLGVFDKIMLAVGGVIILFLILFIGIVVYSSKNKKVDPYGMFAGVGSQLDNIELIGGKGILAVAAAEIERLTPVLDPLEETDDNPTDNNTTPDYNETDYKTTVKISMVLVSVQKDLKIKFSNRETGKLIGNVPFAVEVTKPDGTVVEWVDSDMDGIIYEKGIDAGKYSISLKEIDEEKYSNFIPPASAQTVTVKKNIEYAKVDVTGEAKKESEINVSKEDTKKNETTNESSLTDTVTWVTSTVTGNTYTEVLKSTVPDPLTLPIQVAMQKFYRTAEVIETVEAQKYLDPEEGSGGNGEGGNGESGNGEGGNGGKETTNYTVSFSAGGGLGSMADQTVAAGSSFTLPGNGFTAPEGKEFNGWDKGAVGTSITIDGNITITAQWKDKEVTNYTVHFEANGGSGSMADQSVAAGSSFTLPGNGFTAPEGKEFDGWDKGAVGASITIDGNTTITAKWKDKAVTNYTVHFEANGGSGSMADKSVPAGDYVLPDNGFTAPEGKEFDGWDKGAVGTTIQITGDVTITAQWKDAKVKHTVSFDANSGSGSMASVQVTDGESYTLPACTFTAPDGKVFDKWDQGTGTVGSTITITSDITIKALWRDVVKYKVSFSAGGGSGEMAQVEAPEGSYTLPGCSFKAPEGKVFDKWDKGNAGSTITLSGDITLTAQWRDAAAKQYTISFDANGGSGEMAPVTVTEGSYTLPECTFTAPKNMIFEKWEQGAVGSKITVKSDITLKAVWLDNSGAPALKLDQTKVEMILIKAKDGTTKVEPATVQVTPSGYTVAKDKLDFSVTSANNAIATAAIDANGRVTIIAVAKGTTQITVTVDYKNAEDKPAGVTTKVSRTLDVTVKEKEPLAVTFDQSEVLCYSEVTDKPVVLVVTVKNSSLKADELTEANMTTFVAESNDETVVKISKKEFVKSTTNGTVQIKLTLEPQVLMEKKSTFIQIKYSEGEDEITPAKCAVTVKPHPKNDKVTPLLDKDGKQLFVAEANDKYRPAVYADYYVEGIKLFVQSGVKYTGWQTIDGKVYFFNAEGVYVTGEQVIQGAKYQFGPDGVLMNGQGVLGIDVSKWNGSINWTAVKNSGVTFVIIRCGFRGSTGGSICEDSKFAANIKGATEAGLKVGVYFFTQAIDEVEAVYEASYVLDRIKNYKITYPVFLDVEASGGRADKIDKDTRTKVCKAFCQTIQNSGYTAGIYANKTWLNEKINASDLSNYRIWLAQYAATPTYTGRYDMWQYKSTGSVNGISGDVDMNLSYMGY